MTLAQWLKVARDLEENPTPSLESLGLLETIEYCHERDFNGQRVSLGFLEVVNVSLTDDLESE